MLFHLRGKEDNRVISLEWSNSKENMAHAIEFMLTKRKGENNSSSKLTEKEVLEIRNLYPKLNYSEISRIYSVNSTTVSRIIKRTKWQHI